MRYNPAGSTGTVLNTYKNSISIDGATGGLSLWTQGSATDRWFFSNTVNKTLQYTTSSSGVSIQIVPDNTGSAGPADIRFGVGGMLKWNSVANLTNGSLQTFLRQGNAAANICLGSTDAATAVGQTLSVQSIIAGTTNVAGSTFTIQGSASTGSAAGGSIVFQTTPAGSSGSSQNAFVTALTIAGSGAATFASTVTVSAGGLVVSGGTNISGNNTLGGFVNSTYAGTASNAALKFSGAILTGGTGTTNFPHLLFQTASPSAVTAWSTSGTFIGVNADSAFAGNFLDFHVNGGASLFAVNSSGTCTANGINCTSTLTMNAGQNINWSGRGIITSQAAGNLQLGLADAASVVAQTLSVQSIVTGTSNTAGQNFTIKASAGSGNAAGGSLIIQVAPAGSSGTSQNSFADALTIDSTKLATFAGNVIVSGNISSTRINSRVVAASNATTWTIAGDTSDLNSQTNTQTAGTLTVSAPTGTPVDGQRLILRIKSTNVQTFSFNAIYRGSTDTALPTASTGGGAWDYLVFIYNSADSKWDFVGKNFGH